MTDILFEYDHMLLRSEYRTPDLHAHLAVHLVIALDGELNVVVEDKEFQTAAVFIASDVNHTIYADKGEMLVYLFDSTTRYAAEIPSDLVSLLCDKVNLSKSRLSHLFKEKMGISLHRYIALDKMKKGFLYYMQGQNITDAAMNAGFDSPSHFASTCKSNSGFL